MDKKIYKAEDIKEKILDGIAFIVDPVASTLGPKGNNVLFETGSDQVLTNDGVTIAKNISSKDQIEERLISMIKEASLRTNSEAGDGTTTTVVLTGLLSREALKLVGEGYSWVDVRDTLAELKDKILSRVEKMKIVVDGKKGLREIATISANNDPEIADNVMKAIDVAKEDGMVFLENNNGTETELIEDLGFMVKNGIMFQELLTNPGRASVMFKNVPVLMTDKKLYYQEEAETILRTALKEKHKAVVVVAKDFTGEAINTFVANHTKGVIQVMLVKAEDVSEKNMERLQDLAVYLGGRVITEKTGSLVNKITPQDFVMVNQVYSDPHKTLFTPKTASNKLLKERIAMLKEELAKKKDNPDIKSRLASLTTGVVTIKVGGSTPIEQREKLFRYEDAVNATRSAMKFGYLPGGGTSLLKAFNPADCPNKDFLPLYRKYCEAIVRQIAVNAGKHADSIVERIRELGGNNGYNARTDKFEDLLKAGVVDPFMVIKMAVENSVSVASSIISVRYYMINDIEDADKKD